MIERYLVQYFLAVIDQGNFTRAAQQCGVAQPTLSVGIARLETELGQLLFRRSNRRVELTAAGATFANNARRIEAEFARAAQDLAGEDRRKLLRLGVVSTLPSPWIEAASRAACSVAGEHLELVEGRMGDLRQGLERGRLDAILGLLSGHPDTETPLYEEPYALALASSHPLAGRAMVEPQEIAAMDMLVRRNCEVLADVSRYFTERGIRPFFAARTTSDDRAVAYVRAGLGLTVMPRCFRQPGIAMPLLAGFGRRRTIGLQVAPATAARVGSSMAIRRFAAAIGEAAHALQPALSNSPSAT